MSRPQRPLPAAPRAAVSALAGLLAAVLALCLATPAGAAQAAASSTSSVPAFGVTMPGVPDDLSGLRSLTATVSAAPKTVMWYSAWAYGEGFPAAAAADVAATGAVPEVTWEPWDPAAGAEQPAYSLARIAAGDFDGYVTTWARQIKAYRQPVVLRFAHEMNGSWYPWSEQVNGNQPGDYVRAWRHVRGLFTAAGVKNVTFVWSPNVPYPGSTDLAELYPGDAYVDRVALDGYNWSTLEPGSTWQSFWDVFGTGVGELRALTSRPLEIGEVGCPEAGGDKAAWITDMFSTLRAHPEIRGYTWFDYDKETDWRIDSSASSADAFRQGLASLR